MIQHLQRFAAILGTEILKLRRTPVALVTAVAPYVVVLFFGLFAYFDGERFLTGRDAWTWLGDSCFTFFSPVVLPMWAAIVSAQVAAIEHRADSFKHLFALPVRRGSLYLAKQTLCWLLAAAAFLGLAVAIGLAGWVLRELRPGLGFEATPPLARLLAMAGGTFLASLFLMAFQTWVALHRDDVATPIVVGFLATVSALALSGFDADLTRFHPWAYPSQLVGSWVSGKLEPVWAVVGMVGAGLFTWVAGLSFVSRDVC